VFHSWIYHPSPSYEILYHKRNISHNPGNQKRGTQTLPCNVVSGLSKIAILGMNDSFYVSCFVGVLDLTLCDKVCQWIVAGRFFSSSTPVPSNNKTDHHDITEIVLKVTLNIINPMKIYPSHEHSWKYYSNILNNNQAINNSEDRLLILSLLCVLYLFFVTTNYWLLDCCLKYLNSIFSYAHDWDKFSSGLWCLNIVCYSKLPPTKYRIRHWHFVPIFEFQALHTWWWQCSTDLSKDHFN
jgi:hypothetical protein